MPDAGQVSVLGLGPFEPARHKGRMTALPQDAALGGETRCLEHLEFYGRLQGLSAADARRDGEHLLEEVGLAERRRSKARTLSHGMLRRLTVAQALIGAPELVLLDEPTSGLDPRHAHELRDLLRRTHRQGRTLVISSHNLPELEALCDQVAFLDRGVVAAAGAIDALTGKGQEVEIELGDGPVPFEALSQALPQDRVTYDQDRRALRVVFEPAPARAAEDVIGQALRALLAEGARISGVRRGTSLERKFLEIS
jgi:ABC-type multidrug transport system ATPase subunit